MTEQDKDILIGKMLDSPSSLTDKELSMILTDEELKDIYEISSSLKGACVAQSEMDVRREWRLFRRRILPTPSPIRWIMRVAAIFLGVMLLSGIIVRFTDSILTADQPVVADAGQAVNNRFLGGDVKDHTSNDGGSISEMSVGKIHTVVAKPIEHRKSRNAAKKVEVEDEFDVEEYLRVQRAEMDHEVALLNAEMYLDQRDAIQEFVGYMNDDNTNEVIIQ